MSEDARQMPELSNQLDLMFDPTGERRRNELALGPLGRRVRRFCAGRMLGEDHREFTARELCNYVWHTLPDTAPDSPRRILSLLREQGQLDYECVSRAQSRYRVLGVRLTPDGRIVGRIRPEAAA